MTLMIRFAIMPLMMNQTKKQMAMKEKMAVLQPELNALKEKYKNDVSAEAKKQQQIEMMQLYQKHQFNPLNMGCLPMLLQWHFTTPSVVLQRSQLTIFCGLAWGNRI